MIKLIFSISLLITTLVASGQVAQKLTPQAFENKMQEKKSFLLLDVRTQSEYVQGHLNKATHLDYYRKDFKAQLNNLDKTKPVFVYCAVGGRSGSTATLLSSLGFKEVYDLAGGIQAWIQTKKPIVQ